jgi:hypothetical protein
MPKKIITRVRERLTKFLNEKCYICEKIIGKSKRSPIGGGLYRHWKCEAGSDSWRKSKYYKKSKVKGYF